jgi:hypothetical protein
MPSLLSTAEATAITLSYLDQLDAIADAVARALRDVWMNMSGYDRQQLAEWIEQASPLTAAGTAEGADLAAAYLAELSGTVPPTVADLSLDYLDLEAPFLRTWHDLKEGMPWEDSVDGGASQAEALGQDATNGGATKQMGQPGTKVIAHQRIPSATACDWCQVVATQLYKTAESASLGGQHHSCKCRIVPLTADNAKAVRGINSRRLKELKKTGTVTKVSAARERNRERARQARQT